MTDIEKQILSNQIFIMDGVKSCLAKMDRYFSEPGNTNVSLRNELYERTMETVKLLNKESSSANPNKEN